MFLRYSAKKSARQSTGITANFEHHFDASVHNGGADIIREAFEKAGIIGENVADRELMTKLDFYELGLSGRPDSSRLRQLVCEKLSLPKKLTANALLEVVNTMLDKESLQALIEELTSENNKDKENSVG